MPQPQRRCGSHGAPSSHANAQQTATAPFARHCERCFRTYLTASHLSSGWLTGAWRLQVLLSSVLYAGSHLTLSGFPQLLMLGLLLGTLHVYAKRNLLLPTFTHSLFNTAILVAILLSLPPSQMEPAGVSEALDSASSAATAVAPAVTNALTGQ